MRAALATELASTEFRLASAKCGPVLTNFVCLGGGGGDVGWGRGSGGRRRGGGERGGEGRRSGDVCLDLGQSPAEGPNPSE